MPTGLERFVVEVQRCPLAVEVQRRQLRSSSAHCDQELARMRGGEEEKEKAAEEGMESYLKIQQTSPGRWGIEASS